ncbi:MAG: GGDEF domain-containing protein [Actinomycetes bacterium]
MPADRDAIGAEPNVVRLPSAGLVPLAPDEPYVLRTMSLRSDEDLAEERMLLARDRAAAALDRQQAALDRLRAAAYLMRSYRDELTGALHRGPGRDQLTRELERAQRSREDLVVAFADVVALKQVNDEKGHQAGDDLLRAVGQALRTGLRSYDIVVRYGGDEFVCALPNTSVGAARRRFTDVSNLLAAASPGARIDVGLAQLAEGERLDDVIRRADDQLYAVRRRAPEAASAKKGRS